MDTTPSNQQKPSKLTDQVILFDFDGTLCDSHDANIRCLQSVFSDNSLQTPSREALQALFSTGQSIKKSIESLLQEQSCLATTPVDLILSNYRARYLDYALPYSKLYDGVEKTLSTLAQSHPLHIVSNHHEPTQGKLIDHFGLSPFIQSYMGQKTGVQLKPHPWFYDNKIKKIYPDLPTSKILMVGDTRADIDFAHVCGMSIAWVSYGYGSLPSDSRHNLNYIIDTPNQLIDTLL